MSNFYLERTGRRPLSVSGECLIESYGMRNEVTRWYDLAVYQCKSSGGEEHFILHVFYKTRWEGESGYAETYIHKTLDEVARTLERFDPIEFSDLSRVSPYRDDEHHKRICHNLGRKFRDQAARIFQELNLVENL